MKSNRIPTVHLIGMVAVRLVGFVLAMLVILFLPAGTFDYWEAWVYLAVLLIPVLIVIAYLAKWNPELLGRRMRWKEKEPEQRRIISLSYLYILAPFLLPAIDRRFEWSDVPIFLVAAADIMIWLGYFLFFLVLRENPWASRVVEVEKGQRVVTTGPYALVRHPMYLAVLLIYVATPLALGSYWAVLPSIFILPILVARIKNEESVLLKALAGYREYVGQTRFRLIPYVW